MKTGDQLPARDAEGYLIEPAEWNETVAVRLADSRLPPHATSLPY